MYKALYRKYRPQRFSDVVGQEAITTALSNQIMADKIGHAYLFTGTRGTGKTTCAKIFARAVNCENRKEADPCGECPLCVGIENGSILDVIEIDAASNNSVDDVRDLRDETAYRPSLCRFKVYIIDEVHMLSTSAFNALLKILEEPPSHVIFILATTEIHKVPATILSRCQRFDFARIPTQKIAQHLKQVANDERFTLTDGAALLIARLSDGALRDALSLLDTCTGLGEEVNEELVRRMAGVADKNYLFSLSDAVTRGDTGAVIQLISLLHSQSIEVKRLCEELIFHYRNFILALAKPDGSLLDTASEEDRTRYLQAAPKVGNAFAINAVKRLTVALDKMARSPDARIELELALFDLSELAGHALLGPSTSAPVKTKADDKSLLHAEIGSTDTKETKEIFSAKEKATTPMPSTINTPPVRQEYAMISSPSQLPNTGQAAPETIKETAQPEVIAVSSQAIKPQPQMPVATLTKVPGTAELEKETKAPPAIQASPQGDLAEVRGIEPFASWADIIARMAGIDRMLYSYMKDSTAYTDGRRVLIDGGDMFLSYMREYDAAGEKIKTVLFEVTGIRYGIGPYTEQEKGAAKKPLTAQDTLREWEAKGIPIEYK